MNLSRFLAAGFLLVAISMPGCGAREKPIEGRGTPASLTQKSNVSNPLNVVGVEEKASLADRRSAASRKLGR
jgi:hypothetical protein